MDEQIKYRIRRSLVKENSRNYNSHTMRQRILKLTLFPLFTVAIVLLTGRVLLAHQGHHKPQSQPAPSGTTTNQTSPSSSKESEESHEHETSLETPIPAPMPFTGDMREHLHNKIVHFPLALGITGSLFIFLSLKKPEMLTAARILWFLAAAFAVAAYFTGHAQEQPFEHGAMENIFHAHENSGTISGISLWVGFFLSLSPRFKGLKVFWAIVILFLLSVTGYYGGLLAHS
jgi:uncharacterized membrane protein